MLSASTGKDRDNPRPDEAPPTVWSKVTQSAEETFAWGTIIGAAAAPGTVVCLFGDLGSGKTKLTQGIAAGLSVPDTYAVTSPTFTYVNEYPGRLPLYHIDLYRISSPDELPDLGWDEYIWAEGVVAVEWAERAGGYLPERRIDIAITITGVDERRFAITFVGDHKTIYEALISRARSR